MTSGECKAQRLCAFFLSHLNCNGFRHYNGSLVWMERSQKVDNLHVLATCHSWQNGTRCREGVNVLSFPSSLASFLEFHPYIGCCFHSENFVSC